MRQSLKVAISLLVAILLFAGFVVLAFSGLFSVIESDFLRPGVISTLEREVERLAEAVRAYQETRVALLGSVLRDPVMARAYLSDQVQTGADIRQRTEVFSRLRQQNPDLLAVRFLDDRGRRLHFSTAEGDENRAERREDVRVYLRYDQLPEPIPARDIVVSRDEPPRVYYDGQGQRLIYSYAMVDDRGTFLGTAVFYLGVNDLRTFLFNRPGLVVRDVFVVDRLGIIANFEVAEDDRTALMDDLQAAWAGLPPSQAQMRPFDYRDQDGTAFLLAGYSDPVYGVVGTLKAQSSLSLDPLLKAFLLAIVFVTLFLGVFLVLNLRQDPVVVMTGRVKRFQVEFVQEFIESGDELRSEKWRTELARRKTALSAQIRRGVGRVGEQKRREIDDLINRSWEEILAILSVRSPRPRVQEDSIDLKRIEGIIQRALSGGNVVIQAQSVVAATAAPAAKATVRTATEAEAVEAEGLEELGEAEEVAEAAPAPVAKSPATGPTSAEPPEAVEELEELAEAEEVAEAAPGEVVPVEARSAPAASAPSAVPPPAEPAEAPGAEPVEQLGGPSEAEEVETLEELEELEELAEAEEVAEAAPAEAVPVKAAPVEARSAPAASAPSAVPPPAEPAEAPEAEPVEVEVDQSGERGEAEEEAAAPAVLEELVLEGPVWEPAAPTRPVEEAATAAEALSLEATREEAVESGIDRALEVAGALGDFHLIESPDDAGDEGVQELGEHEVLGEVGGAVRMATPSPSELAAAIGQAPEPLAIEPVEDLAQAEEAELEEVGAEGGAPGDEEIPLAEAVPEDQDHLVPLPPEPEEALEYLSSPDDEPFGVLDTEISEWETVEEVELEEIGEEEAAEMELRTAQAARAELPAASTGVTVELAAPPEPEEEPTVDDREDAVAQFRTLIRAGTIVLYEPEVVAASVAERQSSVVLENGVYQIREDLYAPPPGDEGSAELRELAESVMAGRREDEADAEKAVSGIGDLLGGVENLDLLGDSEVPSARAEPRVAERSRRRAKVLRTTEGSIDMDAYLKQYPDPRFEPTHFRALVEVSRRVQAVAAVLLGRTATAWRPVYSVGFGESGNALFVFPIHGVVANEVYAGRRLAVFNVSLDAVTALATRLAPDDLRFMRRAVLLPVVFGGQPAYLFLAFADERNWTLGALLEGLDLS